MRSVRVRLTIWNVGILTVVLVLFLITTQLAVKKYLVSSVDQRLQRQADSFSLLFRRMSQRLLGENSTLGVAGNGVRRFQGINFRNGENRWVRIYNSDGTLRWPPEEVFDETPSKWDDAAIGKSANGIALFTTVKIDGTSLRIFSRPLLISDNAPMVIQVAFPLREIEMLNEGMTTIMITLIPIAVLIAALVGLFLTDRLLSPVRNITQAAEAISAQDLTRRLPVSGDDEFAQLAKTMNRMVKRLQDSYAQMESAFEQERRFTADASHELRTPLTAIKANTSLALRGERSVEQYRKALYATDKAADLMNKLIQDLLLLAHSDSGQLQLNLNLVNVHELLLHSAELVQAGAGENKAAIKVDDNIDKVLNVNGDGQHLLRMLTNLLENAIRHTPANGEIRLTAQRDRNQLLIKVIDSGEGISNEHLAHITDRFYRVDASRSRKDGGSGLGLAIVKSIIDAHQGKIHFSSSLGQGTTVTVYLPLS